MLHCTKCKSEIQPGKYAYMLVLDMVHVQADSEAYAIGATNLAVRCDKCGHDDLLNEQVRRETRVNKKINPEVQFPVE